MTQNIISHYKLGIAIAIIFTAKLCLTDGNDDIHSKGHCSYTIIQHVKKQPTGVLLKQLTAQVEGTGHKVQAGSWSKNL